MTEESPAVREAEESRARDDGADEVPLARAVPSGRRSGGRAMPATCATCGASMFIGETRCPDCHAPAPPAFGEPATAMPFAPGPGYGDSTNGPPPPEGLRMIIDKQRTDKEAWHDRDDSYSGNVRFGGVEPTFGESVDDIADMMRPTRDARGNIEWDLKYALIGAFVVAVVAGLVFWYVMSIAKTGAGPGSGIRTK